MKLAYTPTNKSGCTCYETYTPTFKVNWCARAKVKYNRTNTKKKKERERQNIEKKRKQREKTKSICQIKLYARSICVDFIFCRIDVGHPKD